MNESFFSYGLLFAMTENLLEYPKTKTADYLRVILNSYYRRSFTGHADQIDWRKVGYTPKENVAIVPFSFGKDSLLTLGLCRDLKIETIPVFFLEPENTMENKNKIKLIREFKKKEGTEVSTIEVPQASLRMSGGYDWGWDNFLTHYTLILIPYMYAYRASYFFWSNEYNREITSVDSEKFVTHQTFEQSTRWLQVLEASLRSFGANVEVASLLERLPELTVLGMLHARYPRLASYQLSCLNDAPQSAHKRWCGNCYECGKVAVYLGALGINPRNVDLTDNMLTPRSRKHFYIFTPDDFHNTFAFNRDEHLYVFGKSAKRGVKGKLIEEFLKKYGKGAKKNESAWRKRYVTLYPAINTPAELQSSLEKIFAGEIRSLVSRMR
jgi:hypothetical protein